jgi:molybdenum cofactor guanylyltransferase
VLAGGQSRRFGSDKALALLRGEPLIAQVLQGLRGFAQIVLTAKEPAKYHALAAGVELVRDRHPSQTPLAGLAAGLAASRYELVFCCAADMPFAADPALLDALFEAVEGHDAAQPESDGAPQPLCAVWRRSASLAAAEDLLRLSEPPGPRALAERLRTARLPWPDPRPFLDADTPEALRQMNE